MPSKALPQLDAELGVHVRSLLFDEPPIALSPTLARAMGLPEAVFLQQLHYWLAHKARDPLRYRDYIHDGRLWVKWTQEELMQQVPLGRSTEPHKRVIRVLKELDILLVEQHLRSSWNQSNFFSLNYAALDALLEQRLSHQCSAVKNTSPAADKTTLVEREKTTPIGAAPSDHYSKTTSKEDIKEPPTPDLVLDELPRALREEVARLVPQGPLGQDFVDLLVARLKRDKQLPVEHQLQYPLSWLKTMMQKSDLDFTPAKKISADRKTQQKTKQQVEMIISTPKSEKAAISERLRAAMQFIENSSHEARAKLIKEHFTASPGRQIRSKVEASIMTGSQPEGRYVQELICSIVESAQGGQNASDV
ncbi:hypothetical protein [Aquabacterium commune]|nr:hypothetical protein [Aquabacterium commune]